ncbi:uncharacterized protein EDB91DRAFT_1078712 [Suillus paluster]|uniref:uncharacterized protein n=1 Tax=Suillus paluster TaxID=48578 RepID=UPI001B87033C|nr:uncharacterized protein EDB91DRAFT_1078712 [Suillus paluster]KAG1749689.1 hypothetical protein EDB91DRAFT_1078712 [Suillus paluster]
MSVGACRSKGQTCQKSSDCCNKNYMCIPVRLARTCAFHHDPNKRAGRPALRDALVITSVPLRFTAYIRCWIDKDEDKMRSLTSAQRDYDVHVSALSTVSSDEEPTIIIAFDSVKYIFNPCVSPEQEELEADQGVFLTSQRASGLPHDSCSSSSAFTRTETAAIKMNICMARKKFEELQGDSLISNF